MRAISGPLWVAIGFVLGSLLTAAVLGRYHHIGNSPSYFTIMDRLTGRMYQCFGGECEEIPTKELPKAKKTEATPLASSARASGVAARDYGAELDALDDYSQAGNEATIPPGFATNVNTSSNLTKDFAQSPLFQGFRQWQTGLREKETAKEMSAGH